MFKKIVLPISLSLIAFLLIFLIVANIGPAIKIDSKNNIIEDHHGTFAASIPAIKYNHRERNKKSIVLAAVGDVMVHSPQYNGAYIPEKDEYDFNENFTSIAPCIQKADFATATLETTLAGQEYGYSGYPLFNSPPEIASALKNCGFDLLFTSNNHALDRGEIGLEKTIQHLQEQGLHFVGTARSQEENNRGYQFLQNGIKIVFFAYTYGTNGIPIPANKEYLINLIDEEKIKADINRAKETMGVDIIVLGLHWGNEYQRLPTGQQRDLARKLIDQGVHLIIGSHPHVVQPMEYIKTEHHQGLVFYSLGNIISNQRVRYRDSGIIALVKIENDLFLNSTHVSLQEIVPTWVYKYAKQGQWKYRILPVKEPACKDIYQQTLNLKAQDLQRLEEVPLEIKDIIQYYTKLSEKP